MRSESITWFQHLHKCAGSSVVALARENGEILCEPNANGNPLNKEGEHLPLWTYDDDELDRFIGGLIEQGVTFVACELGGPSFSFLENDPRVLLVGGLRNPLDRFHSAYRHHYCRSGGIVPQDPAKFWRSCPEYVWNYENYYGRIFSRRGISPDEFTSEDFEVASLNLSRFDYLYDVSDKEWLSNLADFLGWDQSMLRASKNVDKNFHGIIRAFKKGDFRQVVRRLKVVNELEPEVVDKFQQLNSFDQALYNEFSRVKKIR